MDFFQQQAKAHQKTKVLVVYFVLAVICIIAAVYAVCLLIFGASGHHHGYANQFPFWDSQVFFYASMSTLAVIVFGSLYQISALSGGGSVVAESLGGRPVEPGTTDAQERRLLNVVEEMSIASGVPMPKVDLS